MKIAILGAGVAGVSSAIALKQWGFDVSLYERHPSAATIGAGLVLWPNATFVLQQLGVLDEIRAVSGRPTKMQRLSSRSEDLGTINIESINQHLGYDSYSILRSDFQNILIAKLETLGVRINYEHSVDSIYTDKQDTLVLFENGLEITADVIIGADGRMASCARDFVQGDNKPIYQGFINWIGVFESNCDSFKQIAVQDYWGIGERFGIVPITNCKAYWAGGTASDQIGSKSSSEYKKELQSLFAHWPEPIQTVIEGTPVERINKIYVHDHDPVPTWHKNNLIMIGDAAHAPLPTSGQGACQALEDAWHLALCLVDNPGDVQYAFKSFTQIRRDKTANITLAARQFAASLFNSDPHYCETRNANSKNNDFAAIAAAMSKAWGQHLPLS